jgi:hypothetical protein
MRRRLERPVIRPTKTVYRAFVEPDVDDFASARRRRIPGMAWRAIPLAGALAGALVASHAGLSWRVGFLAGGALGIVVYHIATRRRGRRGTR